MSNFKHLTLLEIIEEYASYEGLISSEDELSERFDADILPLIVEAYGEDDQPAINEGFNNWTDSMREDGEIHELQYNEYCYVGRLAD